MSLLDAPRASWALHARATPKPTTPRGTVLTNARVLRVLIQSHRNCMTTWALPLKSEEVEELEVAGSELVLDERALADLRQRCARPQGGFVTTIRTGGSSLRAVARGQASRSSRSR